MKKIITALCGIAIITSCGRIEYPSNEYAVKNSAQCQYQKWGEFKKNVPIIGDVFVSSISTSLVDFKNLHFSENSSNRFNEFSNYVSNPLNSVNLDVEFKIIASNFSIGLGRGQLKDLMKTKLDEAFKDAGLNGIQYTKDRENLKKFFDSFVSIVSSSDSLNIKINGSKAILTSNTKKNGVSTFSPLEKDFIYKLSIPLILDSSEAKEKILSKLIMAISSGNSNFCS